MTPLRLMSRQTVLGLLFLVMGVVTFLLACSPVVLGLVAHPRYHGDVSLPFLGVGFLAALFGAWLLPNSGVGPVATQVALVVAPFVPRIPGLSRVGDPKPEKHDDP